MKYSPVGPKAIECPWCDTATTVWWVGGAMYWMYKHAQQCEVRNP